MTNKESGRKIDCLPIRPNYICALELEVADGSGLWPKIETVLVVGRVGNDKEEEEEGVDQLCRETDVDSD